MNLLRRLFGKTRTQSKQQNVSTKQKLAALQVILDELSKPAQLHEMSHRIALCHNALSLLDRSMQPWLWAALQNELGSIFSQNYVKNRADDLEQAVERYRLALTVLTQEIAPVEWAQIMSNLAGIYIDRIQGEREQNVEQAILCYQQALTVLTQETMPVYWAQTTNDLAIAYRNRIQGDRAQNLEQAIVCYQQALTVRTKETMPVEWAQTMSNLAIAYHNRIEGDRAQNLEQAITLCKQALTVRTKKTIPVDWAQTTNNLANVYIDRIQGDRAENLELAIEYYKQALTVLTKEIEPVNWAHTMGHMAVAYRNRIRGNQAENLEQAVACYEQALTIYSKETMPIDWAVTLNNLAAVYSNRIQGELEQNITQAISCCEQALTVLTKENRPVEWAQTLANLASAHFSHIQGDRAHNVEQAIVFQEQALTVLTKEADPVKWAQTMTNQAIAYRNRIRGIRVQNLAQAIICYEQALTVYTQEAMPVNWAQTMVNLAATYADPMQGDRAQSLEQAIVCCKQALTILTRESLPIDWAQTMFNLAAAYADPIQGDRAQSLEQAILCCKQALTVYTQEAMPVEWARTMNNLGFAYAGHRHGDDEQNLEQAIACYQKSLAVNTLEAIPREHYLTQRNLGNLLLSEQHWHLAAEAFGRALAAGELLYVTAATPEARQAELYDVVGLPTLCAYALARQHEEDDGKSSDALVILERNRARWFAESLALRSEKPTAVPTVLWKRFTATAVQIQQLQTEAQLPDDTPSKRAFLTLSALLTAARIELIQVIEEVRTYAPEFMPEPNFADIQSALGTTNGAEADVAVYLLATSQGGLALLVHTQDTIPIWLNTFTDATSRTLLRDWFEAYYTSLEERTDGARARWFEQVEEVTGKLWTLAMGSIAAALEDLELPSQKAGEPPVVTLIPTGLLALLPLHAAWTEDATTPTGRRYFLDDYAVRYAPSATALRHCRERVGDANVEHLLALDEPKPIKSAGPLPNSAREVKAIASLFPAPTVLQHEQASREATLDTLAAAQVVHFSCHGTNNWRNPLDSGLLLANDELLTVRDFLERHLPNARLATLSACETGIVGTDLPDEVIMLPSALVQAGYAGVVASLWSVADVSTAMLMVRFYQYWREEGLEPVYALRSAQCWVRDTTNKEKADYFGQFVPGLGTRMAEGVALEFFTTSMLAKEGPEARSFAHPFWWGAFYLTGV